MKRHKGLGLSWACGHGQHALDEHDLTTSPLPHGLFSSTGGKLLYLQQRAPP